MTEQAVTLWWYSPRIGQVSLSAMGDDDEERLDRWLMKVSPVTLYRARKLWDEAVGWFRDFGYIIYAFDCSAWRTEGDMHLALASVMDFPDYYGHNLNATNDCLAYLPLSEATGGLVALDHLDRFVAAQPEVAKALIDILANRAWLHLVYGRRLITLAQSDDPTLDFRPIGSHVATWNPGEWLRKNRGL